MGADVCDKTVRNQLIEIGFTYKTSANTQIEENKIKLG